MLMHQSRVTRAGTALRRVVGLTLGIAAASLLATAATASEASVVTTVVSYTDLDLSKQTDAVKLYWRLKNASYAVCGVYDPRQLKMQRLRNDCYRTALADAVAKVNRSTLTQLHAEDPRIRLARRS